MMESVWMIREDGTPDKFEARLANLIRILREKVRQKTMPTKQEKETLYHTFKYFDKDGSGKVTKDEFRYTLEKYGISLESKDVGAFFAEFDPDNSGTITYTEFLARIFAEPKKSW